MATAQKKDNKGAAKDNYDKSESKAPIRMRRHRRKVCAFCSDKTANIDYKDVAKLKKFISERGTTLPRRSPEIVRNIREN